MRLRNPWAEGRGEREGMAGSSVWSGAWRDGGHEWDSEPGLREACNPGLQESEGVFWMALSDFVRCFRRVDTAKLYEPPRNVVRVKVPLPCWTDASGARVFAVRVEVPRTTSIEVVLHQQPQGILRRPGLDGFTPYSRDVEAFTRDLGIAVVVDAQARDRGGASVPPAQLATGLRFALGCDRRVEPWVSCEGMLDGPAVYWAVPVTLNRYVDAGVGTSRTGRGDDAYGDFVVLEIRSAHPVSAVQVVQRGVDWFRRVLLCQTLAVGDGGGESHSSSGPVLYTMQEDAGARFAVINSALDRVLTVSLHLSGLRGVLHSRGPAEGAEVEGVVTQDTLAPQMAQLVAVLSQSLPMVGRAWAMNAEMSDRHLGSVSAVGSLAVPPASWGLHLPWRIA